MVSIQKIGNWKIQKFETEKPKIDALVRTRNDGDGGDEEEEEEEEGKDTRASDNGYWT